MCVRSVEAVSEEPFSCIHFQSASEVQVEFKISEWLGTLDANNAFGCMVAQHQLKIVRTCNRFECVAVRVSLCTRAPIFGNSHQV